jgi:hypothetical protein
MGAAAVAGVGGGGRRVAARGDAGLEALELLDLGIAWVVGGGQGDLVGVSGRLEPSSRASSPPFHPQNAASRA